MKIRDTQLRTSSFIDIQRHFSLFRFFFFSLVGLFPFVILHMLYQYHLEERGRSLTECFAHCLSPIMDIRPSSVANEKGAGAIGEPPLLDIRCIFELCLGTRRVSRRRQIVLVELGLPMPNATFHGT